MGQLHVTRWGERGQRVLLLHGSFGWGEETWDRQRALAERHRLVVVDRRGYGGSAGGGASDFAVDAEDAASLLADGAHLVGHSYGALGCLLAAARHPDAVRSLTVIEPPAFALAADDPAVARVVDRLAALWRDGRELTPDAFRAGFLRALGLTASPGVRLKPAAAEAVRAAMSERPPWEAEIPLDALAAAPFPRLVVCGAWDTAPAPAQDLGRAAFAAVARVLTQRAGARLAVLAGAAHNPQRLGAPFNELLEPIVAGAALGAS